MQKFTEKDVKPFEFSDLKGNHVVTQSQFKEFNFSELNGDSFSREKVTEDTLRAERKFEEKNNFKIDTAVRDSRGLSRQEKTDFDVRIEQEVERRMKSIQEKAYQDGLEQGKEEGKAEALAAFQVELNEKMDGFVEVINAVQGQQSGLIEKNRQDMYSFVKKFTKWIVLKEINEKVYLETLFEKLILELNARKNLTVKIGQSSFADMPEIIKMVEAKVGALSNVRVEVVPSIQYPGIILESENGLIDGSMEGVFANIDKIFSQVVKHE